MLHRTKHADLALIEAEDGPVRLAFTERTGGVSKPPYASLNMGLHVGDDPAAVGENRRRALAALGAEGCCANLIVPNQVHGDAVALISSSAPEALGRVRAEVAKGVDAVVCTVLDVPVALNFADCVPVILTCGDAFAVVHSGWKGTYARIAAKAARALLEATGSAPGDVRAYIGPHILGDEYEVSAELMERFAAEFPCVRPALEAGSRLLDLSSCIAEALEGVGVPAGRIEDPQLSTVRENARFFSYRAEKGACGRHAAMAVMRSPGARGGEGSR